MLYKNSFLDYQTSYYKLTSMKTELTFKQEMFAREYTADGNATRAATVVGYSEDTAYSAGSRLLRNVKVKERIDELTAEAADRNDLKMDEVIAYWRQVLEDPNQRTSDRTKVSELIAKYLGAFKERVEIEDKTVAPSVSTMNLEERVRLLSLSREDVMNQRSQTR